jgi:RND family efflux transporter MFP subunit
MKRTLLIVVLVIGVVGGWLWLKHRPAEAGDDNVPSIARVEVAPLKLQTIAQTVNMFGAIVPDASGARVLPAAYDCTIRKVLVAVGTRVAAGDLLLEIDPSPDAKLLLDSARGTLDLATKALAATQERYDLKLANGQDLLAAQQAEQDARLKVASLEARGLGGDGRILAPVAGVVSKLDSSTGSLIAQGTALLILATDARMEASLGAEVDEIGLVAPGQAVALQSANRADAPLIRSQVRFAGASLDATIGSAEVRVPVPAGAPLLLGEHVTGTVEVKKKEALVAPRSAVLPDDGKQVLFTVKDGKAVRHEVQVGIADGDLVEVIGDNLHAGDPVVVLGNYELTDGMSVQVGDKEAGPGPAAAKDGREAKP